MDKTIFGIFSNDNDAKNALNELEASGYNPKDISIVMKDRQQAQQMAADTGSDVAGGAVSGATTGGVLGALAGLLVGTGVIPGLGALLVGGPIAAALGLTGAAATTVSGAVTGALAGGLLGALTGLGLNDEDAKSYEEQIKSGGILVAVPTSSDQEDEVREVLEDNGAGQIKSVTAGSSRTRIEEEESASRPAYFSEVRRTRRKKAM